jgi:hypothetical protein
MLGTKANTNMNRIKKNKENKFKHEDIITNLKTPTWYFRPVQEWIDNINMNSATWKVISVDDKNGDYTLQRLEAITTKRILEDDGPIYQKERIMRKNLIDNGDYRLWAKDDVEKIYTDALAKAKEEDEANDMAFKNYNKEMINYFKQCNSIAETADQYNLTKEEILDALGDDTLKDATDYDSVKAELLRVANLPSGQAESESRARATPVGGKKSKQRGIKSKQRGIKSKQRGIKSKKRGQKSKKGI